MATKFDSTEFKRRLAKLPEAVKRNYSAALAQDAKDWVTLAKALAPEKSGALAATIKSSPTPTGGQIVEAGGAKTLKPVRKGSGVEIDYAPEQDFGNKEQKAHPFFWTAYRTLKRKFKARRSRALSKAFKEL